MPFAWLFGPRPRVPLSTRLTTARLVLRPIQRGDELLLRQATIRNADHLRPWSPAPSPGQDPTAVRELRALVARQIDEWRHDRTYAFLIENRPGGDVIGRVTLSQVHRGVFQNAYLGYWIDAHEQGQGLTTEAVREVVRFAFGPLDLHRVQAAVMPHNAASRRVLAKAGFREEGLARRYLKIAGEWQDHVLHAITRDE